MHRREIDNFEHLVDLNFGNVLPYYAFPVSKYADLFS